MKPLCIFAAAALGALLLTPQLEARGRNPGSKLIFPVHRSGPSYFTVLTITNINTQPANEVQLGGTTFAHFEYYNTVPDDEDPCLTKSCSIHNDTEVLTPADTLSLLTTCHNAEGPDGNQGFVVVTAQDPSAFDSDWVFNYLVGSELVVNSSGGVYSLNAMALEKFMGPMKCMCEGVGGCEGGGCCCCDSEGKDCPVTEGDKCCCDEGPDGCGPNMIEDSPPGALIGDSFVALGRSNLSLTAFMDDPNDRALLYFKGWNDNEQPMSATKWMGCWFDQRLDQVATMFGEDHLLGTGHDPAELDLNCNGVGTLETGWFKVNVLRVETPGGELISTFAPLAGALTAGVTSTIDGGRLLWELDVKS